MYDCLICDDEVELAEATSEYFEMFGLHTAFVATGKECLEFIKKNKIRLLLLDINLKDESGFLLCKELRKQTDIPIFFISARQNDDDILMALNIGGDDYIKKPYSLSVLLAKVKVVLKRIGSMQEKKIEEKTEETKGIRIDHNARKVFVNEKDAGLKAKEFKLFVYLYKNQNKVVTKDELFANVWGDAFFSDGTLNVHIRKLREKIEKDPNNPKLIKTIWGTGYILEL